MTITTPERTILEALVVSPALPKKIRIRADILLRAGAGAEDEQIVAELSMERKDVLHWRKRFDAQGVRGLWDAPGPGPERRVTPEKEHAVLWEVLYATPQLNWSAQQLAVHHGLSRSAVNRIFDKHRIVRDKRGRLDIDQWKAFADPLFGLTVSGIAGLYYYGLSGVLALSSTSQPFSALHLLKAGVPALEAINGFVSELRRLAEYRRSHLVIPKTAEGDTFVGWLDMIEARLEPISKVYLLMDLPGWAQQRIPCVQEWLKEHPHFKVLCAPVVEGPYHWLALVRRCLRIIGELPMQVSFVNQAKGMAHYLVSMPDESRAGIIHLLSSGEAACMEESAGPFIGLGSGRQLRST